MRQTSPPKLGTVDDMRKIVVAAVMALSAAACGPGEQGAPAVETAADVADEAAAPAEGVDTSGDAAPVVIDPDDTPPEESTNAPVATLEPLDDDVEHAPGARDFVGVGAPTPVAIGDAARTNDSGFGEIRYLDGSFTRLDAATVFEIIELSDEPAAPRVRTSLDIGRTWHRVQDLAGSDGTFVVETAVATASVRGTAFSAVCEERDTCSFLVTEGVVEVVTFAGTVIVLNEGEGVIVSTEDLNPATAADEDHRRVSIGAPGLVIDDWVQTNVTLDETRGGYGVPTILDAPVLDLTGEYEYRASSYSAAETMRIETTCFSGICVPTIVTVADDETIRLEGSYPNGWFSERQSDVDSDDERCVYTTWTSDYLDVLETSAVDGGDRVESFLLSHAAVTSIVEVIDPPHDCGQAGVSDVSRTYRRTGG